MNFYINLDFEQIRYYCTILLFVAAGIQVFYYSFFYLRTLIKKAKPTTHSHPPLSVVICARNEAINLEAFLYKVLEQDYPNYEVIVVNDRSLDETETVLAQLCLKYKHLRYTNIAFDRSAKHGKKLALTVGIKSAKHEYVVLTDADCYPTSNQWLKHIQKNFTGGREIVLAYGGYERKRGLLNKLIRFDSMFIALNYLSFALAKIPYMGVGRNLSYSRDLFFKHKGFASHYALRSGDDDLFVNQAATTKNVAVEVHPESFTRSVPQTTFRNWLIQKRRHLTTGRHYRWYHKPLLSFEPLSRVLFYASVAVYFALDCTIYRDIVLGVIAFKMLLQIIVYYFATKRFGEQKLLIYSLVFDILFPFLYLYLFLRNAVSKRRN